MSDLSPAPGLAPAPAIVAGLDTDEDRAALLLVLAGLFAAPPTPATIASLHHGAGADLLTRLGTDDAALAAPIAALRTALDGGADEDEAARARRLSAVFGLLFLGLGGPATVAPYESCHRCGGRLFQAPAGEMERLLAAHDLSVGFDREPADHLSIETALLAHLVAGRHPDRFALADRLRGWMPAFRTGLAGADPSGFYDAAAALLVAATEPTSAFEDQSRRA